MRVVLTIIRRELRAMFDHPMGYILLVVFLGLNNFLFFRQAYLMGVASMRPMFDFLPWMFLFFVPAVTMRTLSEDLRSGTIEVVLAQPVTELELLLGKYLAQLLFIWLALALTLPIPIGFSWGADLHVGVIVSQYVGAGLLAAGFSGIGLWASSISKNQITAFIVGVAVMFLLVFVGLNALIVGLPPALAAVAANLGVMSHFQNIARGVIDLRDAVYFATLTAIFVVLSYGALMGRKLAPAGGTLKRLRTGTAMLVATLVVVNLFGRHIGGRLDLTPGNTYTLSKATKSLLGNLDDLVTIKLFVSKELPPEIALIKRDLDDLLRDFRAAGKGNVRVLERDPASDEDVAKEAEALGIPPVQFNVVGQGELKVKEGYLGVALQYADRTETIPLVRQTEDLEYRLAADVRSLTREGEPKIGFVESLPPTGPQGRPPAFQSLRQQLRDAYEVRTVSLFADSITPGEYSALVLAGSPMTVDDSVAEKLEGFLRGGGNALVMASGMALQPQGPFASPQPVGLNKILEPYGISIQLDLVYDLLSNERVSLPTSFGSLLRNYPFWLRTMSTKLSPVNQDLEGIFMPWTSAIDTSKAVPGTVTPLFVTSKAGGVESGQAYIDPRRSEFPQDSLDTRLVGVMVNPGAAQLDEGEDSDGEAADSLPRGRLVVVGNGEFASDQWVRNAPRNVVFLQNAVDWLAQDEGLISIRSKNRTPPGLVFLSDLTRDIVKYANVIGIPLLVMLWAGVRLWRRRQLTRKVYTGLAEAEAA
ncbi:MAG: Gldg family protein [Gemmatimonadales bacterium]